MFWGLIGLSLATFAPGILLPEWRNYQFVRTAEQAQTHRMKLLEQKIGDQRRLLQALRSDPAAISRLAQRDLRFRKHGEQAVEVWVPPALEEDETTFIPKPVELPATIARAASFLPVLDYDSVFNDASLRPYVLALPVGLTILSFWLFSGGLRERRRAIN